MELNDIDVSKYLTIDDVSYVTGFAKSTIRGMYNSRHHSYRKDFPKPIKVSIGKTRVIFDKDEIFNFIKGNVHLFNKVCNFEFSLSTPTEDRNYFNIEIYHKPTDTYVVSKISEHEFELMNKHSGKAIDSQILMARLINKIIINLSSLSNNPLLD